MAKFDYDDLVILKNPAPSQKHLQQGGSVVAVYEGPNRGSYYDKFPKGAVYTIEFNDGTSIQVHEDDLELVQ